METAMKQVATFKAGLLANWLRSKHGTWWLVDGDPKLEETLTFPCEAETLADELDKEPNRILTARKSNEIQNANLGMLSVREQLENIVVEIDTYGGNGIYLCWDDQDGEKCEWLIVDKTAYVNENIAEFENNAEANN